MPMRIAISAVIGLELARPRTPSVPKRERVIVLFLSYRRPDGEGLAGGPDIVHPQDGRPPPGGPDRPPDPPRGAPARVFRPPPPGGPPHPPSPPRGRAGRVLPPPSADK